MARLPSARLPSVLREFIARQTLCTELLRRVVADEVDGPGSLRRDVGDELAQLISEVASLQTKAGRKFGTKDPGSGSRSVDDRDVEAPVYWVTDRALQQATPWQVAQLKAEWIQSETIWDLCCGVGGDSLSIARQAHSRHAHSLLAVDRDPWLVAMLEANLRAQAPSCDWTVRCDDVLKVAANTEVSIHEVSIHIDPDRRVHQRRSVSVDGFEPDWTRVRALIKNCRAAIVKLAPATTLDSADLPPESHRCWISLAGSVREQSLLCGEAVARAEMLHCDRSAVVMSADGHWHRFASEPEQNYEEDGPCAEVLNSPGQWLIDPAASIRAAGLTTAFAKRYSLQVLGNAAGFLTCDDPALDREVESLAVVGRVLWNGAADDRKLRREFRTRGWYPETIKVRGTDHDPAKLYKRYRGCGDTPVTLWLGKVSRRVFAAVTH